MSKRMRYPLVSRNFENFLKCFEHILVAIFFEQLDDEMRYSNSRKTDSHVKKANLCCFSY